MKKLFNSAAALVLITVFMAACATDTSFLGEAKKGISSKDYRATLAAVDSVLAEEPNNAEAYYLRGVAYGEIASENSVVANRKPDYQKMRDALIKAGEISQTEKIALIELRADELLRQKWSFEHNLAVQYASGDTTVAPVNNPLQTSIDHLENAVTINPDSTLSYEVLAEVYRMNDDYNGAIDALSAAMERKDQPEAVDYNNLASFYMLTDNYAGAVEVLEEGLRTYPDSVELVQKIADSYMNIGENDKAISSLESLIKSDPNNPQYHLVIGTQLFIMSSDLSEKISANFDQIFESERAIRNLSGAEKADAEKRVNTLKSENDAMTSEVEKLTDRSISELNNVLRLDPQNDTAYNTLGVVYQNKAAAYFELRNATTDDAEAASFDDMARGELNKAKDNYEKAAEIDPDNTDYWNSLFRVYTALGMQEKAQEAMEKAGM